MVFASYGIVWWATFVAVAFVAARLGRGWGMIAGHALITLVLMALDAQWIQEEMHRPGWDGQPDQDFVFFIGMFIRIAVINALLMPVSAIGWLLCPPRTGRK